MLSLDEIRPFEDKDMPVISKKFQENKIKLFFGLLCVTTAVTKNMSWSEKISTTNGMIKASSIDEFQSIAFNLIKNNMLSSVNSPDNIVINGLENLTPGSQVVTNHRGIMPDPWAFIYANVISGLGTPYCIAGDNLMDFFVGDVLRLNNTIIVERESEIMREQYMRSMQLSKLLHDIRSNDKITWVAQSKGRAQRGIDKTIPSVIKMLSMYPTKKLKMSFSEFITDSNIVPLTMSYDIEPNAISKAERSFIEDGGKLASRKWYELHKLHHAYIKGKMVNGKYEKGFAEDFWGMITELNQHKNKITLTFGTPLKNISTLEDAVASLDEKIINNYVVSDNNMWAYQNKLKFSSTIDAPIQKIIEKLQKTNPKLIRYVLDIYANPVIEREKYTPNDLNIK